MDSPLQYRREWNPSPGSDSSKEYRESDSKHPRPYSILFRNIEENETSPSGIIHRVIEESGTPPLARIFHRNIEETRGPQPD